MEQTRRADPQRQLRLRLRQRIQWGRWALLAIVAVSLVNQVLLMLGVDYHFLFSAAMPYYLNWLAAQLPIAGFKAVAVVLTVVLYLVYLACWSLSAQRKDYFLAALGLYAVDTALLVVFTVALLENPASCVLEIICNLALLALLCWSYMAARRLAALPRRRRQPSQPVSG